MQIKRYTPQFGSYGKLVCLRVDFQGCQVRSRHTLVLILGAFKLSAGRAAVGPSSGSCGHLCSRKAGQWWAECRRGAVQQPKQRSSGTQPCTCSAGWLFMLGEFKLYDLVMSQVRHTSCHNNCYDVGFTTQASVRGEWTRRWTGENMHSFCNLQEFV
jgi:hypothetical protein